MKNRIVSILRIIAATLFLLICIAPFFFVHKIWYETCLLLFVGFVVNSHAAIIQILRLVLLGGICKLVFKLPRKINAYHFFLILFVPCVSVFPGMMYVHHARETSYWLAYQPQGADVIMPNSIATLTVIIPLFFISVFDHSEKHILSEACLYLGIIGTSIINIFLPFAILD